VLFRSQDTVKGVWQMLSHQAEVWGLHAGSKKLHNVRVVQLLQRHHLLPVSTATTGNYYVSQFLAPFLTGDYTPVKRSTCGAAAYY